MSKDKENKKTENSEEAVEPVILTPEETRNLLNQVKELEEMREQMLRSAADFENAKKRLEREKQDYVKFAQENLVRELLTVLDNFDRALAHKDDAKPENLKGVITGIEMVFKQLNEILKSQGLTRLEAVGKDFDPHLHEAIAYAEEEGKDGEILDEVEPGYMLHDRLIRASKVRVRKASDAKENLQDDTAEASSESE